MSWFTAFLRNSQPAGTEWSYLKIPYISERLNHRITNIFRKENIPVRVAHKSYTLRQALSHTSTERKSTRDKCPIANTGLCLLRPCPHVSGNFFFRKYFFADAKIFASTRSVFESFSAVHTCPIVSGNFLICSSSQF